MPRRRSPPGAGAVTRPGRGGWRRRLALVAAGLAGLGLAGLGAGWAGLWPEDAVARGGRLYAANCAACHGAALQGAEAPPAMGSEPRRAAPPLGSSGHAWQHGDAELLAMMMDGSGDAAGMPGFAGRLDVAEARAILAFVKQHWPPGMRIAQSLLNPGAERVIAALTREGTEWTFPPDCRSPGQSPPAAPPNQP